MFHRNIQQRGTTLIEVLVSVVVVSIGLLGLVALQVKVQNLGMDAYQRTQALLIVEDMVNRLYANRGPASQMCYDTTELSGLPGEWSETDIDYQGCDPSGVADADLSAWNELLKGAGETLGAGASAVGGVLKAVGCIERDSGDSSLWRVSVAWQGMSEVPLPTGISQCGADGDRFEQANLRRVVTLPVRLVDW